MKLVIYILIILAFSCTKKQKDSIMENSVDLSTKNEENIKNDIQYGDIISRGDSLLNYVLKFQNEKELNEIINKGSLIKSDADSLEIYQYTLINYINNKFIDIEWSMLSGHLMFGRDSYKLIKIDGEVKLLKLKQGGFSNRGLYVDSLTIFNIKNSKLELDSLTNDALSFKNINFFTKDTSFHSKLSCFDLVNYIDTSNAIFCITLQEKPNSCGPSEYIYLEKNDIKEKISIYISKGRLTIEK